MTGLFIKDNQVVCGTSAKKASTKIESVKHALFSKPEQKIEMKKVIKEYKPESILILGTSDNMVEKIAQNLNFPEIISKIYIDEVATEEEMETAKKIRMGEGKHVIPVPTFEIKKEFSGYILDPLQIFKSKGVGEKPYIAEKSIIRPTFSYLGNFTISDTVFRQIVEYLGIKSTDIHRIIRTRIENYTQGVYIYIEVVVVYGENLFDVLNKFKSKIKKEIEKLTMMNVYRVDITAKGIHMEEK